MIYLIEIMLHMITVLGPPTCGSSNELGSRSTLFMVCWERTVIHWPVGHCSGRCGERCLWGWGGVGVAGDVANSPSQAD